jgi:hypothetical protein
VQFSSDAGNFTSGSSAGRVKNAIERLKSLHDGEAAFSDVVYLGADAIPGLRDLLFERERSGLFQARCRAVEALAALKAFGVLADFLSLDRSLADPVERLGEDAVVSTAGRAIARSREDWVYDLLVKLAARRRLAGILAGLGSFQRKESIPIFIDALAEDDTRMTAEAILRGFGPQARFSLLAAALEHHSDARAESETHRRKRRSALGLLLDIGVPRRLWRSIRVLMDDDDLHVALLACHLCIEFGNAADRSLLPSRLDALRSRAGWFESERIKELLRSLSDLRQPDPTASVR